MWERAQGQHRLDRALTLLESAFPEVDRAALASLPVGRRDAALLALRARLFGSRLAGVAECPACGARLEAVIDVGELLAAPCVEGEGLLEHDGWTLRLRLPDSHDLAAVTRCVDAASARALLLDRCVVEASRDGRAAAIDELPPSVLAEVDGALERLDALSDLQVELTCSACARPWSSTLDLAGFVWSEIRTEARRLLGEVGLLARAYGWSEAQILALTQQRRRAYLELAT